MWPSYAYACHRFGLQLLPCGPSFFPERAHIVLVFLVPAQPKAQQKILQATSVYKKIEMKVTMKEALGY